MSGSDAAKLDTFAIQRVKTGLPELDELLHGGILAGDSVLVMGAPGTGKTSLGMQYLYNGISLFDEPGIFITFEEFPQQIYRDALTFGWDFRRLEQEDKLKVLFTSPELLQQDLQSEQGMVAEMIREINAQRVVVDSLAHFRRLTQDQSQYREMIYGVVNALKREGLTAMLLQEMSECEKPGASCEEYISDCVICLTRQVVNEERMRFLEVLKSRGSKYSPVRCLFFIQQGGIRIVPAHSDPFFRLEEAVSTGISQLDDLLGGGIPYGSFCLLEIDSGIHQWLFELNFVKETLQAGDIYLQIADADYRLKELEQAASRLGFEKELGQAIKSGSLRLLVLSAAPRESGQGVRTLSPDQLVPACQEVCQQAGPEQKVRLQIDLSRLLARREQKQFFDQFTEVVDLTKQCQGVVFGLLNPKAVDEESREKIRATAQGMVRIWNQGNYNFIQVIKTVNSVRTPVNVFREVPDPPFVEIVPA